MTAPRTFAPGIYHAIPIADYLAAPGLSKTALDWLKSSPLDYSEYIAGKLEETTPEMDLGRILHAAILEGKNDFVTRPTDDKGKPLNANSNAYKEWAAIQTKPILSRADAELVIKSRLLVWDDPLARKLLAKGQPEVSLFAQDESGRLLKGRPDWMGDDRFVDLKSTTNAETDEFSREIYKRRYHVQAALYLRIAKLLNLPITKWYFIILQKGDRPRLNVRELHESALDLGRCQLDEQLTLLAECEASQNWYGYSGKSGAIEKIDVPKRAHDEWIAKMELKIGGKAINW